ncbi:MAG: hypothetical protein ABIJ41_02645 [Candidatus Omnitrophota bacterium]
MSESLKLHLGCGTNKLSGWVNIDSVKDCQPDLAHDISKPLPYADQSVDEILAEDLLEHFDKYMRFIVFGDWARVLRIGGTITLQVPDFRKILLSYFKLDFDNFVDSLFGENMLRSEVYLGHFGNHKWGYSKKTLKDFTQLFGIEPMEIKTKGMNIRFIGTKKRYVPVEELNDIRIYSHANDYGIGEAILPLSLAKEKVKVFQNNQ